jgi:hypothetical protein
MKRVLGSSEDLKKLVSESSYLLESKHVRETTSRFENSLYQSAEKIMACIKNDGCFNDECLYNSITEDENYNALAIFILVCLFYQLTNLLSNPSEKYLNFQWMKKLDGCSYAFIKTVLDKDELCLFLLQRIILLKDDLAESLLGVLAYMYSDTHFLNICLSIGLRLDKEGMDVLSDENFMNLLLSYSYTHSKFQKEKKDLDDFIKKHKIISKYNANTSCMIITDLKLRALNHEIDKQKKMLKQSRRSVSRNGDELFFDDRYRILNDRRRAFKKSHLKLSQYQVQYYEVCSKSRKRDELLLERKRAWIQNQSILKQYKAVIERYQDLSQKVKESRNCLLDEKMDLMNEKPNHRKTKRSRNYSITFFPEVIPYKCDKEYSLLIEKPIGDYFKKSITV